MNRRTAVLVVSGSVLVQVAVLLVFRPVVAVAAVGGPLRPDTSIRLAGVDVGRFETLDTGRPAGWLPQVLFLVLCAVLGYTVLRSAAGLRPRLRTVLGLVGAVLIAAGAADLLRLVLDLADPPPGIGWHGSLAFALAREPADSLPFALLTCWVTLPAYLGMWLTRNFGHVREALSYLGEDPQDAPEQPRADRRQLRDLVCAGLLPVVLLALAGGLLLKHTNRHRIDYRSVTFDPDLWRPYTPPGWADRLSGVLYPALRLRPLRTETTAGWLGTLGTCGVLLAVLALGLGVIAARSRGRSRLRLVVECWGMTVLAAIIAAVAETWVFGTLAPRDWESVLTQFGAAGANALRFGTVWGWAPGLALAGMVTVLQRRGYGT